MGMRHESRVAFEVEIESMRGHAEAQEKPGLPVVGVRRHERRSAGIPASVSQASEEALECKQDVSGRDA